MIEIEVDTSPVWASMAEVFLCAAYAVDAGDEDFSCLAILVMHCELDPVVVSLAYRFYLRNFRNMDNALWFSADERNDADLLRRYRVMNLLFAAEAAMNGALE